MIAVSIRFVAGRYHATAWDHQVNEGTVEWPPSPWRILRALLAGSYRAASPPSPELTRRVLGKLASELPVYSHVPASTGHLRHWMPAPSDKTKVFDAFVAVGDGARDPAEMVVSWPGVNLDGEESDALRVLCRAVPYLGRAESWAEIDVVDAPPQQVGARPARPGDTQTVGLLTAVPPAEYDRWRAAFVPTGTGRKRVVPPADLWEALHADTGVLQKQGWSQAPGSQWASYAFEREPFRVRRSARPIVAAAADLAWFALRTEAPVRLERSIAVGDAARRALLSRSNGDPVFLGRDEEGRRSEGHAHAYFLPTDANDDGFVDHLLVWAPAGFGAEATRALRGLQVVNGVGAFPLGVVLLNLGLRTALSEPLELGAGTVWESRTPFVPPRHPKWKKGQDLPEQQVARLAELVLGVAPTVEPVDVVRGKPAGWHRFYRTRLRGGGSRGSERGFGFRLVFNQPVQGPVALGYGAHMGLGRFACVG